MQDFEAIASRKKLISKVLGGANLDSPSPPITPTNFNGPSKFAFESRDEVEEEEHEHPLSNFYGYNISQISLNNAQGHLPYERQVQMMGLMQNEPFVSRDENAGTYEYESYQNAYS
jgi:hypothetical protein